MRILFQSELGLRATNVAQVLKEVAKQRAWLHKVKMDDLLDWVDTVGRSWSKSDRQAAEFMSRERTETMLNNALRGDYRILDKFVDLPGVKNRRVHCQPRGLVVQWLAGNVPVLGLYSIMQALLTKNVSVVKAADQSSAALQDLLRSMMSVDTEKIKGADVMRSVVVGLLDDDDRDSHAKLSMAADVRVAWGGHEAVSAITSLPKNWWCEDVVYGPKYSYGLVDKSSLKYVKQVARRLAMDVATFDQYACSSPHTVFVEELREGDALKFAQELAGQLKLISEKFLPKGETDPATKLNILTARAKGSMQGQVFAGDNTDWTVIHDKEPGFAQACFSRVITVKPITDLSSLAALNSRRTQTLGLAGAQDGREELVDRLTVLGIDRVVPFGTMTLFDSPWDGMFALDRMVRWVTSYSGDPYEK